MVDDYQNIIDSGIQNYDVATSKANSNIQDVLTELGVARLLENNQR
ncbi:MAG: hypothetical protein OFPI_07900 [Osedax symbiont Rs2]|nr:MAG: hypothetical protein OFPI_07900 [Osedax symbiont Rs2]